MMPVPYQSMDLPGQQIDAGQEADCPVSLVLTIACEGRMYPVLRRQIGGGVCDRLDIAWIPGFSS